jgi:hypothetical protein
MTDLAQITMPNPPGSATRRNRVAEDGGPPPGRRSRLSRFLTYTELAAVTGDNDTYPLRLTGGQAVVTLPGHIDVSNAGQIREQLLSRIDYPTEIKRWRPFADQAEQMAKHLGATTMTLFPAGEQPTNLPEQPLPWHQGAAWIRAESG